MTSGVLLITEKGSISNAKFKSCKESPLFFNMGNLRDLTIRLHKEWAVLKQLIATVANSNLILKVSGDDRRGKGE